MCQLEQSAPAGVRTQLPLLWGPERSAPPCVPWQQAGDACAELRCHATALPRRHVSSKRPQTLPQRVVAARTWPGTSGRVAQQQK